MSSEEIIGTCSICNGAVKRASVGFLTLPRCENCGAIAKPLCGPIIPMETPNLDWSFFDYKSPVDPSNPTSVEFTEPKVESK